MNRQARRSVLAVLVCLLAFGALATLASGAPRGAGVDVRLHNMLPASIKSAGVIQAATNAEYRRTSTSAPTARPCSGSTRTSPPR
jgi:hypothetical protein